MEHEDDTFFAEDVELDDDLEALAVEDLDASPEDDAEEEDLRRFMAE